jgi:glycosyltransferase 2 family protein
MANQRFRLQTTLRHILLLVAVVVVVYLLLPQFGDFRSSGHILVQARPLFTTVAIVLAFATFAAGAGTYCLLAARRLDYARTLLVQLAAMFVNRLLPAGMGAVGVNYLYLRHERHSAAQAGSIVAMNNLLGFMGHFVLLGATLLIFSGKVIAPGGHRFADPLTFMKIMLVVSIILLLSALLFGRSKVTRLLKDVKKQLLSYKRKPWVLLAALGTSMILTLCNVGCLFFCAYALNMHISFVMVILVFTLGVGVGAAIPTPGGIGGFEAGLAGGFVAYGVDPASALAAALLFRLVSYWLPFGAGAVALVACQRRKLLET